VKEIAREGLPDPPVQLATTEAELPLPTETVKQVAALATTPDPVHVKVIPLALIANVPPAVTPVVAALLMLNTVGDTSIVTVNVLLYTSSAAVGSAPVFHTVVSDQTPVLIARTIAILTTPSHQ
jgi:hypothetical protein